ncbi:MAG: hypothetical protein KA248_02500 [Kiritimatiellae bacterium]|nr:hypothetical protein [Kiritimatiellia bacterium]
MNTARLTGVLLLLAAAQVLLMALFSPGGAHPDEELHVTTASFFLDRWLPPAADDPLVPGYLDPEYGTSYLLASPPQILYPLAAKAARLSGFSSRFALGLRLGSVAGFLALAAAAWRLAPRTLLPAVCLLWTPQVWYTFSYFNSDAFPFFLSFLIALLVAGPGPAGWRRAAPAALLLGLLLLAKHNYWPFAVFAVLCLAWRTGPKRALAVAGLAAAVAAPLLVRDAVINRFEKEERKAALREEYAADAFKPSRIGTPGAYAGLALRAQGVSLADMLAQRPWARRITRSFGGVYGHMNILAPPAYYIVQNIMFGFLFLAAAFTWRGWTWPRGVLLLMASAAGLAVVLIAALFCWMYDFQPQGRYLFPLLPTALLAGLGLSEHESRRIPWFVPLALFLLASYSFIGVGLGRLWP